jgi:hypothetical protein
VTFTGPSDPVLLTLVLALPAFARTDKPLVNLDAHGLGTSLLMVSSFATFGRFLNGDQIARPVPNLDVPSKKSHAPIKWLPI